jgi:hypothetical protein
VSASEIEPLIRDLQSELTDQRIAGSSGRKAGTVARVIGPHLNNWICFFRQ